MKLLKRSQRQTPSLEPVFRNDLFDQFHSFFDDWFQDRWVPSTALLHDIERSSFSPALDVSETDTHLYVRADIPGMNSDDLNVEVSDDTVILSGTISQVTEDKKEHYYRCERQSGSFTRELPLPHPIESDSAAATVKDGVLTISMKKQHVRHRKSIPITKG